MPKRIHIYPQGKAGMKRLVGLVLAISLFALITAVTLFWQWQTDSEALLGFLIKSKDGFIVAWKQENADYKYLSFPTLKSAIHFAHEDLKLESRSNPIKDLELEHLWLQDRFGAYSLLWKTTKISSLHQLTFQSESEAIFFANAFRKGAYSPSPFGHSVLFLPSP